MRKFSKEDLLDMDFDAYLASSSDEEEAKENDGNLDEEQGSDEDEERKINKYKVCISSQQNRGRISQVSLDPVLPYCISKPALITN